MNSAKIYAINCHQGTNHYYDKYPYEFHLEMVVEELHRFKHLIQPNDFNMVISAGWLYDTIEDTRRTYNDIKKEFGTLVADLVYALTNEKGKNRFERANKKYYKGIRRLKYATLIKLCDRIANVKHGLKHNSNMILQYYNENPNFIKKLKKTWFERFFIIDENNYKEVINYLNNLFKNVHK